MKKAIVTILAMLMLITSVSAKVKVKLAGYKSCLYTLSEICNEPKTLDTWLTDMATEASVKENIQYSTTSIRALSKEHRAAMIELVKENPDMILWTKYQGHNDLLVFHNGEFHFLRVSNAEKEVKL